MVVAFEVRRPWPRPDRLPHCESERWNIRFDSPFWVVAGRRWYFPSLVTVWHVEPGGKDSGEVCLHYRRDRRPDGKWETTFLNGWRWHVHHWRIQVRPLQKLRRVLLTRCAWCGGPGRKRRPINVSGQWDRVPGPWWRGEQGLYHADCHAAERASRSCVCDDPLTDHSTWGTCLLCGRRRGRGSKPEHLAYVAVMQRCPQGVAPSHELLAEALAASEAASAPN
jgi:hypothetical protein